MENTHNRQRKASISDVAEQAGVSTATVSRAFSHPDKLSPKTLSSVLETAEKLDFSISRTPGILKSGHSYRVALLIGSSEITWFTAHIIEGLNSVFSKAGYDLAIYPITNTAERQKFFAELPVRGNVDAVVISSFDTNSSEIQRLRSIKVPIVGINPSSREGLAASINIDDVLGVNMLVRHLAKLGHRNLLYLYPAFLTNLNYSSAARPRAFSNMCATLGLHGTSIRYSANSEFDTALTELMRDGDSPTAICFLDDEPAIPFFSTLPRHGFSVPEDVSIVGFDDSQFAKEVGLTTIRQRPRDMAEAAATKTLRLIESKSISHRHETAPIQLVIRTSTGRPRH